MSLMTASPTVFAMSRENWWNAAKIVLGLPLLFYALLSGLEPQKEIWRRPTRKVLVTFVIAWAAVFCFIAFVLIWNSRR